MVNITNPTAGAIDLHAQKSAELVQVDPKSIFSVRHGTRTLQIPTELYREVTQRFELRGRKVRDEAIRKRRQLAFYQIHRLMRKESALISSEFVERILGSRGRLEFMRWLNGSAYIENRGGYIPGQRCNAFAIRPDALREENVKQAHQHNIGARVARDGWICLDGRDLVDELDDWCAFPGVDCWDSDHCFVGQRFEPFTLDGHWLKELNLAIHNGSLPNHELILHWSMCRLLYLDPDYDFLRCVAHRKIADRNCDLTVNELVENWRSILAGSNKTL